MAEEEKTMKSEVLVVLTDFIFKLTWGRVFMTFVTIVLYYTWENREHVIPIIFSSWVIIACLVGGLILIGVGLLFRHLLSRIDEMNAAQVIKLTDKVEELETELMSCRIDCKAEAKATHLFVVDSLNRIERKLEQK